MGEKDRSEEKKNFPAIFSGLLDSVNVLDLHLYCISRFMEEYLLSCEETCVLYPFFASLYFIPFSFSRCHFFSI